MASDLLPEIEDALDTWQEGLSQFMYGPAERERLTAILRAKLFAFTRPAPALPEIVAAAEDWVASMEAACRGARYNTFSEGHKAKMEAARTRFLSLVAAHAADVAKVLEPYAKAADPTGAVPDDWTLNSHTGIFQRDLRAAADLRRRVTAALHEKMEG